MTPYTQIFGTGGIGSGVIYALEGNHTLGREETRLGTKLPNKDFCKLHIISHYLTVILGEIEDSVEIYPVGAVGNDREGRELLELFDTCRISRKYVKILDGYPTLFSVCFQYPDGSGGNITESRSASSVLSPGDIDRAADQLEKKKSIVFAVPEVPLETRLHLLELKSGNGVFRAASFLSSEIRDVFSRGIFQNIDLCALNMDEAKTLVESRGKGIQEGRKFADICNSILRGENPDIEVLITDGKKGSYAFSKNRSAYLPAFKMKVSNSAGAGDAFFAGLIIGKIMNLPFISEEAVSCFKTAHSLASLSVESRDTIHFNLNSIMLKEFIEKKFGQEFL